MDYQLAWPKEYKKRATTNSPNQNMKINYLNYITNN